MRVRFLKSAEQEFADAEERYEGSQEGLGAEFYQEIDHAISEIALHPIRWPTAHGDVRRLLANRFPYAIFYQVRINEVVIVAIMHTSRSPGYWRRRVTKK